MQTHTGRKRDGQLHLGISGRSVLDTLGDQLLQEGVVSSQPHFYYGKEA